MTPEQFAYWFQGFAELSPTPPTPEQWQSMRDHVATVFKKVTPAVGPLVAGPAREPLGPDFRSIFDEMEKQKRRDWDRRPGQVPFGPAIC